MKNIMSRYNRKIALVLALVFSVFLLGGTSQAVAREGNHDRVVHPNRSGHHYGYHHHHRGYWGQRNGVRFWFNVG